jgi:tripartite ATP-independent transporter DctP family solute receptor
MSAWRRLWMLAGVVCIVSGPFADRVEAQIVARLGHGGSDTHPFHIWSVKFAEEAGRLTNGKLKVQVFPNSQLGKERDMAEGLLIGNLEMCVVGTGTVLPVWVPEIGVLDGPFIYRDLEHFYKVQDGLVGAELKAKLEAKGMKHLGWADIGARDMTNNRRPINKPADLVGLKMRVPDSKVYVTMMKALGATVVPVNFAELYMALQQGVADGQENPATTIRSMNYWEVQKYLSLTHHIYSGASGLVSTKWLAQQPADVRAAIEKAGQLATDYTRPWVREDNQKSLDFLKSKGVVVNTVDQEAFRNATEVVYKELADVFPPDLVRRIRETR